MVLQPLKNAAREPEIVDLALLLNEMGARRPKVLELKHS